ncbi:hypothetical protein EV126DRAFT_492406 [Verticillium dahliae]|nr:hypothetical protein EV126DRAFT_492406 [Verticillium dahliae]
MFFHCRRKQRPPPVFPRTPCARLGCNRRALRCESHERGITFYSFYCKDHACRHRAGNVMCPNHKQAGETRYCEDRTSRQPKPPSAAAAAADPSSQTPAAGPRTAAVPAKQPTGTRHGHTVLDRAPDSHMCAPHTPRCLIPDCPDPRSATGLFCAAHSCAAPDCDAVIAAGAWCRSHTPCRVPGCTRPRAVLPHTSSSTSSSSGGTHDAVCAEHAPRACRRGGCTAVLDGVAEPQQQRVFCAAHECLRVDCRGGRQDTTAGGGGGGVFCEAHACEKPLCGEPVVAAAEGARYCQGHECRVAACRGPRAVDSPYCPLLHACQCPGCPGQRAAGRSCCDGHDALLRDGLVSSVAESQQRQRRARTGHHLAPLSPMEEALSRRLMQERARQESEARLREEMMAWREGIPYGLGARERMRSWDTAADVGAGGPRSRDSGLGTSSDDCTFVG